MDLRVRRPNRRRSVILFSRPSMIWIVYRPLLGIALIAVAVALVVVIKRKPAQAAA